MDRLKMHSLNKVDDNIKRIGALFPNCITERKREDGTVEYAIDFDILKQELSSVVVEGSEERYQFTWPDKKKSILLANAPIAKTLRPCREESVDFDNTENLYIEGDNLDVLKLLQETYLGKIKMIYIDPPYNTGNDFVYNDDFAESADEYLANSGQFDEEGNRLVTNTESNGRFHTDWLNMIYPRLKIAKDLLAEDGIIIISIDDHELSGLRSLCDEVFGESNFVANVVWQKIHSVKNDARYFSENHEYAVIYARNIDSIKVGLLPRTAEMNDRYKNPDNDPRGPWQSGDLVASGERSNGHFIVKSPITGKEFDVPQGKHWVYSKDNLQKLVDDNQVWFGLDGNSFPRKKRFLCDVQDGRTPSTLWLAEEVGHNQSATREVKAIFDDEKYFDFPKPIAYIKQFARLLSNKDCVVLDFFSGSATTAHAVMQLNAEDGGNRKFIMIQLPEETDEKSEAYKAGYKSICEIGKERIRRAGAKIKRDALNKTKRQQILDSLYEEKQHFIKEQDKSWVEMYCSGELTLEALKTQLIGTNHLLEEIEEFIDKLTVQFKMDINNFDTGFRVLKLDSTNMKDVYYNPADYELNLFDTLADNIKEDRTPEDLLFQVMLDLGVLLSSKIEESTIGGKKVFTVAPNTDKCLVACFDENVTEDVITEIAKKQPYYFVMRDSSIANDSVATNFEQIFATYSPNTVRKVL